MKAGFGLAARLSVLGLLAFGLVMRVSSVVPTNLTALMVGMSCYGSGGWSHAPAPQTTVNGAWLAAWSEQCGRSAGAQAAWQGVIRLDEAHLRFLRVRQPYDNRLAGYAAELYPANAEAQLWLAEAHASAGDRTRALKAYETALRLEPWRADAWLTAGELYLEAGQADKAVAAYDMACQYVDRGKNGCIRAGQQYLAAGDYAQAADRFEWSLRQIGPGWPASELGLGEALVALGRTNEALPHLRAAAGQGSTAAAELLAALGHER